MIASRSGSERKTSSATSFTSITPFSSMDLLIARLTIGVSIGVSISDGAASAIACATACTASLVDFVSAIAKSACANSARLPTLVSTCASRRRISPVDRLTTKPEQPLLPGSGSTVPKGTTCVPVVPSSATSSRCTIAPR